MNDPVLVAYYTSQLEPATQVVIYSKFLEKMITNNQRSDGLMAAEKFSLPVEDITKRIVITYRYYLLLTLIINILTLISNLIVIIKLQKSIYQHNNWH